jgi:phosphotriesterase-related protein
MGQGLVMTVTGALDPSTLGATLMHEHLLWNLTPLSRRGSGEPEVEITLENLHAVTYRPGHFHGNHRMQDVDRAIREASLFAAAGGGGIVEMTTGGIAPDPEGLARVSQESGVAVIMGAGFYTEPYLDEVTLALSVESLADLMVEQIDEGAWGTSVRCGIIGEIGCSWPLTDFERRSLRAAARAQIRTGAAVTVHPGRHPDAPHEILDVLDSEGADLSRVIIDHMDRTYPGDDDAVVALARRGCVVEYDFFGIETSQYWMAVADLPTDYMRLRAIRRLFDAGFADGVVVSHDICTRSRLQTYGGHGYSHLIRNVPQLMRDRGFSDGDVATLLVDNPKRLLTIG